MIYNMMYSGAGSDIDAARYQRTLTVNGWSNKTQSITINGITNDATVVISPAPNSVHDWADNYLTCTSVTNNTLTFTCETVPITAVTVNILYFKHID